MQNAESDDDVARQGWRERCIDRKSRRMRTEEGNSRAKDVGMMKRCWLSLQLESFGMTAWKHCPEIRRTKQRMVRQDLAMVVGVDLEVRGGNSSAAGDMPQHR